MTQAHTFQSALTTRQLKLKQKSANIVGLQLADLLGHPVKQYVLQSAGQPGIKTAPFADKLLDVVQAKFNRHLYEGRIEGYGMVLFPK